MLGNIPGKERRKYTPDYVVYDLETTGISCQWDEVIEISAIRVQARFFSDAGGIFGFYRR